MTGNVLLRLTGYNLKRMYAAHCSCCNQQQTPRVKYTSLVDDAVRSRKAPCEAQHRTTIPGATNHSSRRGRSCDGKLYWTGSCELDTQNSPNVRAADPPRQHPFIHKLVGTCTSTAGSCCRCCCCSSVLLLYSVATRAPPPTSNVE